MRLTLRTLLAYRDGVLDPADAAILEAKIRESSMAQQISLRIEEGMRNRKLAPIPVDAREFGFEANMVAEFLDDTISMESLPEMERKCLEYNNLLSEIGSCHQILSRALSVPAAIPSSLRQRIRELPNVADARSTLFSNKSLSTSGQIRRLDTPAAKNDVPPIDASATAVASVGPSKAIRKTNIELRGTGIELDDGLGKQVPEYLLGTDRAWISRAAMGVGLVAALIIVGAMAIGPLERVGELLRKSDRAIADVPKPPKKPAIENSGPNKKTPQEDPAQKDGDEGQDMVIEESTLSPPPPNPTAILADANRKPAPSIPDDPSTTSTNTKTPTVPAVSPTGPQMQWLPDSKPSSESIVMIKGFKDGQRSKSWRRMHPGDKVRVGERVVVPPAQRTEMRIEPGIRWLCAGENDLEVATESKTAKVRLLAGRALIFATPDASSIEVDCNGLRVAIKFSTPDSSCALEMQNAWVPTDDASLRSGNLEIASKIRVIGVQGQLEYAAEGSGYSATKGKLDIGQYVTWSDGEISPMEELVEAPWWLHTSFERPIDQLAATDLQRALAGIDPDAIETELLELTNHRRGETASLAARARMMIGKYENLFSAEGVLNRKGLHNHWPSLLAQLQQSLGRNENCELLVACLQNDTNNRANSILSLLVPKSQEQLEAGADKLLVDALSSPNMDERILAISQLTSITGKNLGFQPDKNSVEAIRQWLKLLGKNEIRYPESKAK